MQIILDTQGLRFELPPPSIRKQLQDTMPHQISEQSKEEKTGTQETAQRAENRPQAGPRVRVGGCLQEKTQPTASTRVSAWHVEKDIQGFKNHGWCLETKSEPDIGNSENQQEST